MAYLLFDPLFLYALLINGDTKCLVIDYKLKIFALLVRSWGDLRYLLRIYRRVKDGRWKDQNQRMLGLPGEILAVLPIPHVRSIEKPSNSIYTFFSHSITAN